MAKEKDIYKLSISAKGGSGSAGNAKIGLIPPFGSLFELPMFIDKKLLKNKKINLPAGSYTESVIMSVKDYLKLENPVQGSFAVKK
jgi:prolyl-tRNA editing enzyme YbaK/EbsC (Cys-tRNA(Pro) deacylase)